MEFRLLYEGELLSSGGGGRPGAKHEIRRSFHPQLRRLWRVKQNLKALAHSFGARTLESHFADNTISWLDLGISAIGKKWSKAGYELVPLVTAEMEVQCSLDILLLRPEGDRFIFTSGDIDGQVKTLFDALRIPQTLDETGGMTPQEDETPFFCLLEDDRLISEVRVVADQLLLLPHQREAKASDAFVVIHVKLNHKTPGTLDQWF